MTEHGRCDQTDPLDARLGTLLKENYPRPEPRPAFRNDLLKRLKEHQGLAVRRRRRRILIRRVAFGSAGGLMAASIALMVAMSGQPDAGADDLSAGAPVGADAGAGADNRAWTPRVRGPVEVAAGTEGVFGSSKLLRDRLGVEPVQVRTRTGQGLVEIAPGVRLVMDRGSLVRIQDRTLQLQHGLVSLRVDEGASPVRVRLPRHEVSVESGSWLGVDLEPAEQYARAGRPAPNVTLLEGRARLADADESFAIEPGCTYRLYNYPSIHAIQARRLDRERLHRNQSWVQPTLVNYLVPAAPAAE